MWRCVMMMCVVMTSLPLAQSAKFAKSDTDKLKQGTHEEFAARIHQVNDKLRQKWARVFAFYDTDQDGAVCRKDFDQVQTYLLNTTYLSSEKKAEVSRLAETMWPMRPACITLEQMLYSLAVMLEDGRLETRDHKYRTGIFHVMDEDCDGRIDLDEFFMFEKSLNMRDDEDQEKAFHAIDKDGDGLITLHQYVRAYKKYLTNPHQDVATMPLFGL